MVQHRHVTVSSSAPEVGDTWGKPSRHISLLIADTQDCHPSTTSSANQEIDGQREQEQGRSVSGTVAFTLNSVVREQRHSTDLKKTEEQTLATTCKKVPQKKPHPGKTMPE